MWCKLHGWLHILPFQMKEIDDLKQRTLKTENYIHGMESKLGTCKLVYKSYWHILSPALRKPHLLFANNKYEPTMVD